MSHSAPTANQEMLPWGDNFLPVTLVEDLILHTKDNPFCADLGDACPCQSDHRR